MNVGVIEIQLNRPPRGSLGFIELAQQMEGDGEVGVGAGMKRGDINRLAERGRRFV
jgi:hypothetical protein